MRAALAILLLAAACAKQDEASRWRAAGKIYVLVDTAAFAGGVRSAIAARGYGNVTVQNAPPVFLVRNSGLMVYLKEDDLPKNTSFTPMTPHQAAQVALDYPGSEGICAEPDGPGCTRSLGRDETVTLEYQLREGAGPPLPFALMRKP